MGAFPDAWVTIEFAAKRLRCSESRVKAISLMDDPMQRPPQPYLIRWRPTERRLLISAASLERFVQALSSDPDFWKKREAIRY